MNKDDDDGTAMSENQTNKKIRWKKSEHKIVFQRILIDNDELLFVNFVK
jgi:hypothetical protein